MKRRVLRGWIVLGGLGLIALGGGVYSLKAQRVGTVREAARPASVLNGASSKVQQGEDLRLLSSVVTPEATQQTSLSPQDRSRQLKSVLADARRAVKASDLDKAAELIQQAFQIDPQSTEAKALKEDLREAQQKAAQEEKEQLVSYYCRQALSALGRSDPQQALVFLRAAHEVDPLDADTFKLMNRSHELQGRLETQRRVEEFKQRIRLAKKLPGSPQPVRVNFVSNGKADQAPQQARPVSVEPVKPKVEVEPAKPKVEVEPARPKVGIETTPVSQPRAPVEPQREAAVFQPQQTVEYTIQPEDVLQITVYEEEDLTTKVRVSRIGDITFPMLGRVSVAGLTVSQFQDRLTQLLAADYLVHPQVQVFIETSRNVFVTGEVNKPGSYPLSTEKLTTALEIIAMAGGFTEEAEMNGTRIIRMEEGQKKTLRVRLGDVIAKGDRSRDEVVRPDDIVYVPESFF